MPELLQWVNAVGMIDCIASHFNGWKKDEHLFSKMP
jgi:hypothetical protein